MKKKILQCGRPIFTVFICALLVAACGKTMVIGKVVDAETGKPVSGAAVHIYWGKPGSGPPGLGGKVKVSVTETLTDASGRFEVPKYNSLFKHFYFAVYKQGYVCWSSRKVFPSYEERRGFKLRNNMVIALEHFSPEYSKEKHSTFTAVASINRIGGGIFDKAIKSEKHY